MNLFTYILLVGLTKIPMDIMFFIFYMFIGTLNKNIAMSEILTLIIFLLTDKIIDKWSMVKSLSIITRFFITNNLDFSIYLSGNNSSISRINLLYSIIIYLIYFIFLLKLTLLKFNKLEIYKLEQ